MKKTELKRVLREETQEYNLSDEDADSLKHLIRRIVGRPVSGTLYATVDLSQGGVRNVKLRVPVN